MDVTAKTDITARINSLKSAIERGKSERAKAEANKETYEKQLQKVEEDIRAMNVDPESVDNVIAELDAKIQTDLTQVEALIPKQYRGVM